MDIQELSRKIRNATPFINHLDIEITKGADDEFTELTMPLRSEFTQHLGHAHGGIIGTLADIAANLACKKPTVTLEYKINFLSAADGEMLIARSKPIREGRSFIVVSCDVFSVKQGVEKKVATSLATVVPSQPPSIETPKDLKENNKQQQQQQ